MRYHQPLPQAFTTLYLTIALGLLPGCATLPLLTAQQPLASAPPPAAASAGPRFETAKTVPQLLAPSHNEPVITQAEAIFPAKEVLAENTFTAPFADVNTAQPVDADAVKQLIPVSEQTSWPELPPQNPDRLESLPEKGIESSTPGQESTVVIGTPAHGQQPFSGAPEPETEPLQEPSHVGSELPMPLPVNQPPRILSLYVPDKIQLQRNQAPNVSFSVSAEDPEGQELLYQWQLNGQIYDPQAPLPVGLNSLTVLVKDQMGLISEASRQFEVLAPINHPPVFNAILLNPVIQLLTGQTSAQIIWELNHSDPDGDPIYYKWQVNGQDVPLNTNPTFPPGVYKVSFYLKDSYGAMTEEHREVTILAP